MALDSLVSVLPIAGKLFLTSGDTLLLVFLLNEPNAQLKSTEWHSTWGRQHKYRSAFMPAYLNGFAPIVAAAVHSLEKPKVRILTVGGGVGTFTTHLLPRVRELLKHFSNPPEIELLETDLYPVIEKVGGRSGVDVHNLPFAAGSFDVVVGESMLHAGEINRLHHRLGELKKVLGDKGLLVYLQDAVPDVRASAKIHGSFSPRVIAVSQAKNDFKLAQRLHQTFSQELVRSLETHAFDYAEVAAVGLARINKSNAFKPPFQYPRGTNSFGYLYGVVGHSKKQIPVGKIDLEYQGIAYLATLNKGLIPTKVEPALRKFGVIK